MPAGSSSPSETVTPTVQPFRLSPVANIHLAFGSVAVLLVLLILLTPALENGGLTGGSTFLAQGEVLVDLNSTDTWLFTVTSYGNVVFSSIDIGVNLTVVGPVPGIATQERTWNVWTNATDVQELTAKVSGHPFVEVNVTEVYVSPSTSGSSSETTVTYGVYAFDLISTPGGQFVVETPVYPISTTDPVTLPASSEGGNSWAIATLPQSVALAQGPSTPTSDTAALPEAP